MHSKSMLNGQMWNFPLKISICSVLSENETHNIKNNLLSLDSVKWAEIDKILKSYFLQDKPPDDTSATLVQLCNVLFIAS